MTESTASEPINILFCEGNTDGTVGGSFFSLLYLVSGLNKKKYNPIVVFHNEHALLPQYHQAGIETLIIPVPTPLNLATSDSKFIKPFNPFLKIIQKTFNFIKFFPLTGLKYARIMKKRNVRLVHLNNSIIRNSDWMLGARLAGIKCITHERGINQSYSRMARYFAPKLDAIVCISDAVRENLCDKNINPGNLVTIYNAINPDLVKINSKESEIRKKHNIPSEKTIIGVLGNIKEWKGQETIVRAMPQIIKSNPDTVCLLVGDTSHVDQYYKDRLLSLIEELNIKDHIIFTGYTRNVADYLAVMKIVIHTSVEPEPFGRVLIEAMSMKKPLIGTRAGAVPEIIDENITGFTFPPGDAVKLGNDVVNLLSKPKIATQMGEEGYKKLINNFHISVNIRKTEELYEKILD